MDSKEIQECTDSTILGTRLRQPDVRKKERRLLRRKIARMLAAFTLSQIEVQPEPIKVKKLRAPRKKKIVE